MNKKKPGINKGPRGGGKKGSDKKTTTKKSGSYGSY